MSFDPAEERHQLAFARAGSAARAVEDQALPRIRELRDRILREGYHSSASSDDFAATQRALAECRGEMTRLLRELAARQVAVALQAAREALFGSRADLAADEAALLRELVRTLPDRSEALAEQTTGTLGGTKAAAELLRGARRQAEDGLGPAPTPGAAGRAPGSRRSAWWAEFQAKVRSPDRVANIVWGLAGLLIGALLGSLVTLIVRRVCG